MALLGRWTGGAKSQGNLPESWTAPANLFDTQQRNDASTYSFDAATSILTLPSSNLPDGYLVIGYFQYVDTSNGRLNPQGRFIQSSGTGDFISASTGGYNRDNSEDTSYVRTWAFINNPSAAAQVQFQWKADTDDSTGGTSASCLEVIPFYYSDIGLYSSTSAALYGGTTPNQVSGFSGADGTNITISGDTITLAGDNKRYLCLGSYFFEGRGGRTQRWGGFRVDGAKDDSAKAYSYYRNTANDETGEFFSTLLETATVNRTLDMFVYRGDGIGAGQGGADVDGSTPGVGTHSMVVLELNDSAECFHSKDGTGGIDLNVTGPVDQVVCRTTDIDFNDAASFTRSSDTSMNAEQNMDGLFGADISAAQEVISTTSRWTASGKFTINGTEDNDTEAGDYARNNQGSQDTFGWSANLLSFVGLTSGDDIGVSVQELAGGEDGGRYEVQPGWTGFWGINLDTLEETGGTNVSAPLGKQGYSQLLNNMTVVTTSNVAAIVGSIAFGLSLNTASAATGSSTELGLLGYSLQAHSIAANTSTNVQASLNTISYTEALLSITPQTSGATNAPLSNLDYALNQYGITAEIQSNVVAGLGLQGYGLDLNSIVAVGVVNVAPELGNQPYVQQIFPLSVQSSGSIQTQLNRIGYAENLYSITAEGVSNVAIGLGVQNIIETIRSILVSSGASPQLSKMDFDLYQGAIVVQTTGGVTVLLGNLDHSLALNPITPGAGVTTGLQSLSYGETLNSLSTVTGQGVQALASSLSYAIAQRGFHASAQQAVNLALGLMSISKSLNEITALTVQSNGAEVQLGIISVNENVYSISFPYDGINEQLVINSPIVQQLTITSGITSQKELASNILDVLELLSPIEDDEEIKSPIITELVIKSPLT